MSSGSTSRMQGVLEELHETHLGTNKMKGLARGYVWWPKMDEDIEELVKCCESCQKGNPLPPKHHYIYARVHYVLLIYGNGHYNHGVEYIWILLDRLWDACIWS